MPAKNLQTEACDGRRPPGTRTRGYHKATYQTATNHQRGGAPLLHCGFAATMNARATLAWSISGNFCKGPPGGRFQLPA